MTTCLLNTQWEWAYVTYLVLKRFNYNGWCQDDNRTKRKRCKQPMHTLSDVTKSNEQYTMEKCASEQASSQVAAFHLRTHHRSAEEKRNSENNSKKSTSEH